MKTLTIGFMLIATGKYDEYVKPFIQSAQDHFLPGIKKHYFIFTDRPSRVVECASMAIEMDAAITAIRIDHLPFPLPTHLRFHRFLKQRELLSKCDYLAYCDVDTRWVGEVTPKDVLSSLSATRHYAFMAGGGTFEADPKSSACLKPIHASKTHYYAGGFILGTPVEYFKLAEWCARAIDDDFAKNFIAVWHDESMLNKYLSINPPQKKLPPDFHYPEFMQDKPDFKAKYPPKLLLLDKDHKEIRAIEY